MIPYRSMDNAELRRTYETELAEHENCKKQNLSLNIARGKPSKVQLDLVSDMLTVLTDPADCICDGVDARNYGEITGMKCAHRFWAELLGCRPEQVLAGGNSSLFLMYNVIAKAYSHGLLHSVKPWNQEAKIRFLCPSPGYDRHFRITEAFGAELITIPMTPTGPDMDMVEEYVKDPTVKGIWCVPKYSNPDGIIYSDETIRRFAHLDPAAPDFIIMWDNAYCLHDLGDAYVPFPDILSMCEEAGHPDMVYEFASTSKITFPGAGVAVIATSEGNLRHITKLMSVEMISFDKINQLRHVLYLKNKENTLKLMRKHAAILAPKFNLVCDILDREIAPLDFASWVRPTGGYFISFNTMPGTARRALELCAEAGLTMTPAGATFPYGVDPQDSNIRIAPSLPPLDELEKAMHVFCNCLKLAALEKLLAE